MMAYTVDDIVGIGLRTRNPADRIALGILAELFPDRRVIGIHCLDLVLELGAIHYSTHEEPAV